MMLMPEPNCYRFLPGVVRIADGDPAYIASDTAAIPPSLADVVSRLLGVKLTQTGRPEAAKLRFSLLDAPAASRMARPESYAVDVTGDAVVISAKDARGFRHGLETVRQLAVERPRPGSCLVQRATVLDHPHLGIRGVHLYLPARADIPFFRRLVEGLAMLKYNRVYFEVSGMEYRRHPEINTAWRAYCRDMDEYTEKAKRYQNGAHRAGHPWYRNSMHIENAGGDVLGQDEVRDLVAWCAGHGIEVVPEVQSLSHCDYLVIPHPEIAERPDDPYPDSYCPSNPKSYELLFDVIDEVLEVFRPAAVSIGHDEWYTPCLCPTCATQDAAELLARDVTKIHGYLAARGIEVEMFGDKLLDARTPDGRGQGGAFRIVENYETSEVYATMPATWRAVGLIPKDVLVANWYWWIEPGASDWYARHGIGSTTFMNLWGPGFRDWDVQSRKPNVKGGVVSHWDLVEEQNMAREGTLANLVWSSALLWSEGYADDGWAGIRDRTIAFLPRFRDVLAGEELPGSSLAPVDVVTFPVRHEQRDRYYGDYAGVEVRSHRATTVRHGTREGYSRNAAVTEAIACQSFRIAVVNDIVDSLVFRHATSYSVPFRSADQGWRLADYRIGFYTVRYVDDTEAIVDIHHGSTIGAAQAGWGRAVSGCSFTSDIGLLQAAYRTRPWVTTLNQAEAVTVYDYEWPNPFPEREIATIGLTVLDRGEPFSIFVHDVYGLRCVAPLDPGASS